MQIRSIRPSELSSSELLAWEQLTLSGDELASPFLRPEFTLAAAEVWPQVRVAVLESGGQPVAFFPHERHRFGVGRPVAPALSDVQGVIGSPATPWSIEELLRGSGLACIEFNHLVATQLQFRPYHIRRSISPQIDLSFGYDAYRKERRTAGSEQIKKLEGLARKMEREVGASVFVADTRDPAALSWIREERARRCRAMHYRNVLSETGPATLIDRLLRTESQDFRLMLSTLCAGGHLVAAHIGLRSRNVWHYWFPSHNDEYARYSPGLLLLMRMAQVAPSLGVRTIDLGKGSSEYKSRFMSRAVEVADARLVRRSIGAWPGRAALALRRLARRSRVVRSMWTGLLQRHGGA